MSQHVLRMAVFVLHRNGRTASLLVGHKSLNTVFQFRAVNVLCNWAKLYLNQTSNREGSVVKVSVNKSMIIILINSRMGNSHLT